MDNQKQRVEEKLYTDIWNMCVAALGRQRGENKNEDWIGFATKHKDIPGKMRKSTYKKIIKVQEHVDAIANFAEQNGIARIVNRREGKIASLQAKDVPTARLRQTQPSISELNEIVKRDRPKKIIILDTWIQGAADVTRLEYYKKWAEICDEMEFFLLDPESQFVRLRFKERKEKEIENIEYAIQCLGKIVELKNITNDIADYCDIRIYLYDNLPATTMYMFDGSIFYGPYLSNRNSESTFTHHIDTNTDNEFVYEHLSSHIKYLRLRAKNCDYDTYTKIRDSFQSREKKEFINREKLLQRMVSNNGRQFMVYNVDDPNPEVQNKFQSSILDIDIKTGKCKLIITSREDEFKLITYEGEIKAIGEHNLLFRFRRLDFFLSLLVFIGTRGEKRRDVFQGIYIHLGINKRPRTSYALLVSQNSVEQYEERPTRNDSMINSDIKRFFTGYVANQLPYRHHIDNYTQNIVEGKISDETSRRKMKEYAILKNMIGEWIVYYPDWYTQANPIDDSSSFKIAASSFIISRSEEYKFKCKLITDDSNQCELSGSILVKESGSKFFIECSLSGMVRSDEDKKVHLNIFLYYGSGKEGKENYHGTYNIVYSTGRTLGCGFITVKKGGDGKTGTFNIHSEEEMKAVPQNAHYLVSEEVSSLVRFDDKKKRRKTIPLPSSLTGVYKAYLYVRKNNPMNTRGIAVTRLSIGQLGQVRYEGLAGSLARGNAFLQQENNMYIELINSNDGKDRTGYIIVKTPKRSDSRKKLLCGVFIGLGIYGATQPLAKRIILERVDHVDNKIEVESIPLHDQSLTEKIDKLIVQTLTGRVTNYIGFQRINKGIFSLDDLAKYNDHTIDMGKIFLKATLYDMDNYRTGNSEDIKKICKSLERVVLHSNLTYKELDDTISKSRAYQDIISHPRYDRIKRLLLA